MGDEGEKLDDITSLPGVQMLGDERADPITFMLRRAARESGHPRAYREFVGPTWLRMALIGMTVGGGLTGLMHGMLGLSAVFAGNGLSRDVLCKLALSAFLLVSGVLFVTSRRLTRPLMVSLLLQIPLVSSPFIGYRFFAGLMVVVYFVDGNIGAIDRAGAEFWFEYRPETAPLGVGVNLVALILLVLLLRNQAIQYE